MFRMNLVIKLPEDNDKKYNSCHETSVGAKLYCKCFLNGVCSRLMVVFSMSVYDVCVPFTGGSSLT